MTTSRRATLAVLALAGTTSVLRTQQLEISATLHLDATVKAPEVLRAWIESSGLAPRARALAITWNGDGAPTALPTTPAAPDEGPFSGRLTCDGTTLLTFRCTEDGRETWVFTNHTAPRGLFAEFVDLLGLAQSWQGEARVDLPALVGSLTQLAACADDTATDAAILAGHCGELRIAIAHANGTTRVTGRSHGGLVVPVLAAWHHFVRARAQRGTEFTAAERLVLRARALRSTGREEAARQLARHDDTIGRDALLRLCRAEDYTRVVAMEALARQGRATDLPTLVAAADPRIPGTVAVVAAALEEHATALDAKQRASVDRLLAAHHAAEIRELVGGFGATSPRGQLAAGWPPAPRPADVQRDTGSRRRPLAVGFGILLALTIVVYLRERTRA